MKSLVVVGLVMASAGSVHAQTGDRPGLRYVQPLRSTLHPAAELDRLAPLLHRDATFDRLHRAARLTLDLAMIADDDPDRRVRLLEEAEAYARQALERRPDDLDSRFLVGAAMGVRVQYMGTREKMRTAEEIRGIADDILERDPEHAGGLHLEGQLHAAAMRLNPVERFLGRTLLGGDLLGDATWADAERCFRAALEAEPANPAHRWELALLLRDTDREPEARSELSRIVELSGGGPLIEWYRERARSALERTPD